MCLSHKKAGVNMSVGSVGEINLDLNVNQKQFNRQMTGIQTLAKKAGVALAAALSVKVLLDFGKSCIELGSDLAEVQNVVDVTFPRMTKQVSEFAQSAAASFGLSETMAKKFAGTFGAMAKAFGFSEKSAYEMSTALTGLAGDVASFYNLSQDEAYTKLKSVFTGETESLKDLGVVMTQSALDAYALANGYGKITAKMSEAEKVSLRYAFVQEQLTAAAGDFTRTSDGWANQVRILSLQFDSLKATIGQGLINVLTPVIKVINAIIGKLTVLANAFKSFTEMLTGKKSAQSQIAGAGSAAEESLNDAAGAADDLSDSTSGVGSAAKKAAKEMKALMGFDAINKLSDTSGSSGSGGSDSGSISAGTDTGIDFGLLEEKTPKCKWLDDIKAKIDELTASWINGFVAGIGDAGPRLENIRNSIDSIKQHIASIFTDNAVMGAADNFTNSFSYAFGQITGSAASVGITMAQNITGGIADYLQQNEDRIKQYLVNMFDIGANISEMVGEFCGAFAYVFEVFGAENGQKLTSNLIGIFTDSFMGVSELCGTLTQDIIDTIIQPFVENKDGFRTALDGYLGALAQICETIKETIDNTFDKLMQVYEEHIRPFFDSVKNGLSELAGKFLEFWNINVQPIMDGLALKFDEVVLTHIQPMLNIATELLGTVADALKVLWEQIIIPFMNWIIENILPVLLPMFEELYTGFMACVGFISDLIAGLLTNVQGIIDFLVGVFTGDWNRAWKGVQEIVNGVMNQIKAIINLVLTIVNTVVTTKLNAIKAFFGTVFKAIQDTVNNIMSKIKTKISEIMSGIKTGISSALDNIKTKWSLAWNSMKDTVIRIFNGIWSGIKNVINTIIGGIEKMANGVIGGINGVIGALNNLHIDVPDWVTAISGISGFGFNIPSIGNISIPKLAEGGYVRANTPQLAMIGDNRHQGEIVAPEDKLKELAMMAIKGAGTSGNITREELQNIVDSAVIRIVSALYSLGFNIDGEQLAKAEKIVQKGMDRRYNTTEII